MSFAADTTVAGGPGAWRAHVEEGWDIFGVTNGGYLMAMAGRAMGAETEGRTLISATGTFLNAAGPGDIDITVEPLKHGRHLSTLRAAVSGPDRDLVVVTGVYADPERSRPDLELTLAKPPTLPPPEECLLLVPSEDGPLPPPFVGKVEIRLHPDDAVLFEDRKPDHPRMRGWFRLRDGEVIDPYAVVLAADAFPPVIFNSGLPIGWTPTIELSVQVRNPSPSGWLACGFTTRLVTGGMLEEDSEIWDESGRLVAISRQLALVTR